MKRLCTLVVALLFATISFANGFTPVEKPHPRLFMKSGDFNALQTLVSTDSVAEHLHNYIAKRAERYLTEPVSERILEGKRLLSVSRKIL